MLDVITKETGVDLSKYAISQASPREVLNMLNVQEYTRLIRDNPPAARALLARVASQTGWSPDDVAALLAGSLPGGGRTSNPRFA